MSLQASSVDSSVKEDHIYATLSETFGSMSSFSDGYINEDNRCPSVTTVANDDFEFHDPRTSGCSIEYHQMKGRNPCLRQQSYSSSSFSSSGDLPSFGGSLHREDDTLLVGNVRKPKPRNLLYRPPAQLPQDALNPQFAPVSDKPPRVPLRNHEADVISERNRQNMMNAIKEEPVTVNGITPKIGFDNMNFESDTLEKKYYMQRHSTDSLQSSNADEEKLREKSKFEYDNNQEGTLSRKHRVSSLSMSDLDRLENKSGEDEEDQMMFLLPVKSESMLSLYKLYLAEEEESLSSLHYSIEVSKSENDLSTASDSRSDTSGRCSREDMSPSPHEIYQKRRRPPSAASRVRRQHKIQRARGVQMKTKPPSPNLQYSNRGTDPNINVKLSPNCPPLGVSFGDVNQTADGGVRVAIMDKTRRQNGIITIKDPSGLSVQELFSVLNRATMSPDSNEGFEKTRPNKPTDHNSGEPRRPSNVIPTYNFGNNPEMERISPSTQRESIIQVHASNTPPSNIEVIPHSDSAAPEFRKIFLSEYL